MSNKIKPIPLFFILLLMLTNGCQVKEKSPQKTSTHLYDDEFQIARFGDVGIDSLLMEKMEDSIINGVYPNIHSVLILKNGSLVYENYFEGQDERWGDSLGTIKHHKDSLHDIRSISKSIVAACTGIALQHGLIDSIAQNVFDFFPKYEHYNTGLRSEITIETLLTMTTGMEWNEDVPYTDPSNSEIQMTNAQDPIAFILSRPILTKPGTVWGYNGGTTQLLASIIERNSGMNIHEFAKKHLFEPLGIVHSEWVNFPGLQLPAAASGLRLRSRDLLKFGMLHTNGGKWKGRQILTSDWVKKSKQIFVNFGRNNNVGYGYQFWIFKAETIAEGQNHLIPTCVGNGDQRIYLDEEHNMILVFTAGNYNRWDIRKNSEAILTNFIYPALNQ
ncbi:MAG: serine hydrolase [Bacteroidota bacterium]